MRPWVVGLTLLLSACQCGDSEGPAAGDVGGADLTAPDTALPDRSSGVADWPRRPDADTGAPDLELPTGCGGTRTIAPRPETPYAAKPCGTGCKQVTFGNSVEMDLDIHGDVLVYSAWRPEIPSPIGTTPKVYYVDLKTGKEWRLHDDGSATGEGCFLVSTDGKRIAYSCLPKMWQGPGALYYRSVTLFDIAARSETDLACVLRVADGKHCRPLLVGLADTGVVLDWSLGPCKTTDALFYRFSTGKLENLSKTGGRAGGVHAWGNWVVWQQGFPVSPGHTDGPDNVVLYDTTTAKQVRVDPTPAYQCLPRMGGGKVVWTDHRNSKGKGSCWNNDWGDIYVHDTATQKTTAVTQHPAQQDRPDVWGDWVVWIDWRNAKNPNPGPNGSDNSDIYAKNLKTNKEYQLTNFPGLEYLPRIYKNTVVFTMLDAQKDVSLFAIDLPKRLGL